MTANNQKRHVRKILGLFLIAMIGVCSMPIRESKAAGLDLVYAYSVGDDTASALATGLNSGLNYESNPGQGWSLLTGAGMKIISDYGDQLTRCYLYALTGDSNLQCQLGPMTDAAVMTRWNAYLQSSVVQSNLSNIVGFNLSDDWHSKGGTAKKLFQDMTAAVHTYAPGHRSICTLSANTSYAGSAQSYSNFAAALNFSPSGCDMVGIYYYPTVNNVPLTNFTNAVAGLKLLGLNPAVTPVIGIAESYNTTGAAVEKQVKFMCDNGATSIGFWAYNTGMGTAAAVSADIRGGMSRGIEYCGGSTGGGAVTGGTISNTGGEAYNLGLSGTNANPTPASGAIDSEGQQIFPAPALPPATATGSCTLKAGTAGLIPCGKNFDDPATVDINECQECTLRSLMLMGQLIIDFLLKLAAVVATLAIIIGGFTYVFAVGKEENARKAKAIITAALIGFVIIFCAWMVVDSILMTLGYINPMGGSWHVLQ